MGWRWVPDHKPSSSRATPDSPSINRTFPTQGEAETWLGEFYPSLLRAGVRADVAGDHAGGAASG